MNLMTSLVSPAMKPKRRVLGIDPGLARLGWAAVESRGASIALVGCGCIETSMKQPVAERLILGAEVIDGATAGQLGIVQWAVPRTKLPEFALEIIRRVASLPAGALTASKVVNSGDTFQFNAGDLDITLA